MLFLKAGPAPVREPLSVCFGGGGIYGISFNMGIGHAFIESGLPVNRSPMLGTSAGSWTAASLATGKSFEHLMQCWEEFGAPTGRIKAIELTRKAFGTDRSALVTTSAVRIPTMRRHLLSGFQHDLADVVAASSSPPGYARPHAIGPTRYIDGGVVSNTSANKAVNADLLIVITPVDRQVLGAFGKYAESAVWIELTQWRQKYWGQTLLVRPTAEIATMAGKGSAVIASTERAPDIYQAAYEYGLERAEQFLDKHPGHARTTEQQPAEVASA